MLHEGNCSTSWASQKNISRTFSCPLCTASSPSPSEKSPPLHSFDSCCDFNERMKLTLLPWLLLAIGSASASYPGMLSYLCNKFSLCCYAIAPPPFARVGNNLLPSCYHFTDQSILFSFILGHHQSSKSCKHTILHLSDSKIELALIITFFIFIQPSTSRSPRTLNLYEACRPCTTATVKRMMIALIFTVAIYGPIDVFLTLSVTSVISDLLLLNTKPPLTKSLLHTIRLLPNDHHQLPRLLTPPSRTLCKGYRNPTHQQLLNQILLRLETKAHPPRPLETNPMSLTLITQSPPM